MWQAILHVGFRESAPLKDHIVVIVKTVDDLSHLLAPMRLPHVTQRPVLVMTDLSAEAQRALAGDWEDISELEHVYLEQHNDNNR